MYFAAPDANPALYPAGICDDLNHLGERLISDPRILFQSLCLRSSGRWKEIKIEV